MLKSVLFPSTLNACFERTFAAFRADSQTAQVSPIMGQFQSEGRIYQLVGGAAVVSIDRHFYAMQRGIEVERLQNEPIAVVMLLVVVNEETCVKGALVFASGDDRKSANRAPCVISFQ